MLARSPHSFPPSRASLLFPLPASFPSHFVFATRDATTPLCLLLTLAHHNFLTSLLLPQDIFNNAGLDDTASDGWEGWFFQVSPDLPNQMQKTTISVHFVPGMLLISGRTRTSISDLAYGAIALRVRCAISGTDLVYRPSYLRTRSAMPDTELACMDISAPYH
eukprot:1841687-Rhodomonas_salina.3